jgi:hypothetical protein
MRSKIALLLVPLVLAACGTTRRETVVVAPGADKTVVVPSNGNAVVVRDRDRDRDRD